VRLMRQASVRCGRLTPKWQDLGLAVAALIGFIERFDAGKLIAR